MEVCLYVPIPITTATPLFPDVSTIWTAPPNIRGVTPKGFLDPQSLYYYADRSMTVNVAADVLRCEYAS